MSPTGFWTIASTVTGGTYTATCDATGFTKTDGTTPLTATGTLRFIKGPTGGSTYTDASTVTQTAFSSMNITGQTTFSDFAVGGLGSVLPIEFQSITAIAKGNANLISWATASEKDVTEFAIERSANNQTWATIGTKKAVGGQQTTQYAFADNAPLALNYYRIRSIELDNKDQLSKVVAVKRNGGKLALNAAFPMPITEGVTLDFSTSKAGKITAILTDILGKVVKTELISANEGSNSTLLNVAHLASGTYILTLNDGETRVNQRLIKQ